MIFSPESSKKLWTCILGFLHIYNFLMLRVYSVNHPSPPLSASISVKATVEGGGEEMKHDPSLGDGLAQYLYIYTASSSPSHLVRFQSVFPTSPKYSYYAEKYARVGCLTV